MTRPPSAVQTQSRAKAGFGINDVLAEAHPLPRSILVVLLLLLITVLGGVLLLLDPHTSSPHELKSPSATARWKPPVLDFWEQPGER